ncbi:MAG: hypothetical protein LBT73_00265, partial [Tannerellaceae bacterium]|nr:hypothetical protein [Tannerellaceae bacterium]
MVQAMEKGCLISLICVFAVLVLITYQCPSNTNSSTGIEKTHDSPQKNYSVNDLYGIWETTYVAESKEESVNWEAIKEDVRKDFD